MAELPLIPSTVVGSHGKGGWWYTAVKAHEAGIAVDELGDRENARVNRVVGHGADSTPKGRT